MRLFFENLYPWFIVGKNMGLKKGVMTVLLELHIRL